MLQPTNNEHERADHHAKDDGSAGRKLHGKWILVLHDTVLR
jgi:hypothetical protein